VVSGLNVELQFVVKGLVLIAAVALQTVGVVLAFGVASEGPMPNGEQFPWLTVRVLDEPAQRPCPLVRAALSLVAGSNA
jgi:hypothetical protein